jgi:hypothetical protein
MSFTKLISTIAKAVGKDSWGVVGLDFGCGWEPWETTLC